MEYRIASQLFLLFVLMEIDGERDRAGTFPGRSSVRVVPISWTNATWIRHFESWRIFKCDLRNASKIDTACTATKPQEKLPASPDLEHRSRLGISFEPYSIQSLPVIQYRYSFHYTNRDGLDVFSCLWRGSYLSTWREIDNRLDKSVPTAFLTAPPLPSPCVVLPPIDRSIDRDRHRSIDRSGPPFIDHTASHIAEWQH